MPASFNRYRQAPCRASQTPIRAGCELHRNLPAGFGVIVLNITNRTDPPATRRKCFCELLRVAMIGPPGVRLVLPVVPSYMPRG